MYRKYDFIIFDANNLVGYYCIKNLLKLNSNLDKKYSFAVAFKKTADLQETLKEFKDTFEILYIGIIQIDMNNKSSIKRMTQKCKVLLSVDEFSNDSSVMLSCMETFTHYVDISVDHQFIESIQHDYFSKVKMKRLYFINSCGLLSIPSDLGILYLKDKNPDIEFESFDGYINTDNSKGFFLNFETISTLFGLKSCKNNLTDSQNKLYSKLFVRRPVKNLKKKKIFPVVSSKFFKNSICVPFCEFNEKIVRRTQYMLYQENVSEKPSTYSEFLCIPYDLNLIAYFYIYITIFFMSLFSLTQFFLKKIPNIFTLGYIQNGDPSKEKIENKSFQYTLIGKGFIKENKKEKATKSICIKGPELAHDTTSIFLINSAITVLRDLEESNKNNCGVLTPGYAFKKTNFLKRLPIFEIEWQNINF